MSMGTLHPIDREAMLLLEPLFSASLGEQVCMSDELEYFDRAKPNNWLWAREARGEACGFVRAFPGGADWGVGEVFVASSTIGRKEILMQLLEAFGSGAELWRGYRLRFEALANDKTLNEALRESAFSQKEQRFLHYSLTTRNLLEIENSLAIGGSLAIQKGECGRASESRPALQAGLLAEVLSNLHPVAEAEARAWIESGTIRGIFDGERLVAAAQVCRRGNAMEINRIATAKDALRRGYATELLEALVKELVTKGMQELHLKVESTRGPAIAFYRAYGFKEAADKERIWHSRFY